MVKAALLALLCSVGIATAATVRISRQGKYLYTPTGSRFYIKCVSASIPPKSALEFAEMSPSLIVYLSISTRSPSISLVIARAIACARSVPSEESRIKFLVSPLPSPLSRPRTEDSPSRRAIEIRSSTAPLVHATFRIWSHWESIRCTYNFESWLQNSNLDHAR